jgi:hypothetical protein
MELDIYIQEKNLAIEFNGVYWHSVLFKDKYYHYNKWKTCKEHGIKLLTIWEDDWQNKQGIIKSIIANNLKINTNKIYARKCNIQVVKNTKEFLNSNHLQRWCQSSINLGLYYNNGLVSLMTFGKRKITGNVSYELLRFCSILNTNVTGGASKLFNFFIKQYNPSSITSYASCDISDGSLYKILGFKEIGHDGLNYKLVQNESRKRRSNFMKYKQEENQNQTEQKTNKNSCYKIFGTGNLKYLWVNESI